MYPVGGGEPLWYFLLVLATTFLTSCASTVMFVSQGAFFAVICDPLIGGTYMTLLNTLANFGFAWPQFFVYRLVDLLTTTTCIGPGGPIPGPDCLEAAAKEACVGLGGQCVVERDGYYTAAIVCFVAGLALFLLFIQRAVDSLQRAPLTDWRPPTPSRA